MTIPGSYWASDSPISMPEPSPEDVVVDMGAMGFTMSGLVNNLSLADLEEYSVPTFSPEGVTLG